MITDVQVEALERVLRELLVEHESLVELARRHREALRKADGEQVTAVSLERDAVNERIVRLNEERVSVTSAIAAAVGGDAKQMTVRAVIQAVAPERADRLSSLADRLRQAVEATRREHSILRDATAAFAGHLDGVLHRAIEMCAPSRTYTNRGRVAVSSPMPGALDVRH